jgi:DNA-binding CsgD family transcriptional regulator
VRSAARPREVPPAAFLVFARSASGRPVVHLAAPGAASLLGTDPATLVDGDADRLLTAAVDGMLRKVERGAPGFRRVFRRDDPSGGRRVLRCTLHGMRDADGVPVVLAEFAPWPRAVRTAPRRRASAARSEPRSPTPGTVDDLLRLLRISAILLEEQPLERALKSIALVIADAPEVRSVTIGVETPEGRRLRGCGGLELPPDAEVAARAIAERRIVHEPGEGDALSITAVPIESGGRIVGVLELRTADVLAIGPWQEEVLGSYADYVAALLTKSPVRPRALRRAAPAPDEIDLSRVLTARQQDVLYTFVDSDLPGREVARALGVAETTLKVHIREILRRLEVDSRSEAVRIVFRKAPLWLAAMRARRDGGAGPGTTGS